MNKFLIGLVVLAAGVGIGWYYLKGTSTTTVVPNREQQVTPTLPVAEVETPAGTASGTEKGAAVAAGTVAYTATGFTPKTVTVKAGTGVTFVNQSSNGMWVASDVHPTHQLLPGFDELKSVVTGGSYTYVFTKVGRWKYHNHMNPSDGGTVVVTQ